MITQKEWVEACYALYRKKGITPGDEKWGRWEEAHYPLPRDIGDEWVYLLHNHHQVLGMIQSEEMGRCCFFAGDVEEFLINNWCDDWFELFDLYEKWLKDLGRKSGLIGGAIAKEQGLGYHGRTPEQMIADGRKGGIKGGQIVVERGLGIHARTPDKMSADGRRAGRISAESPFATNKQLWVSLADGFVSGPGPVARHNRAIGADPAARVRVDDLEAPAAVCTRTA